MHPEVATTLQHTYGVLAVPFLVLHVPADQFGYLFEERLVAVGWVRGDQFDQGHKIVLRVALQEAQQFGVSGGRGLGMTVAIIVK